MIKDKFETTANSALRALPYKKVKQGELEVLKVKSNNHFFLPAKYPKRRIVLHHTAGNVYGDLLTLTQNKLVSVPYLIGRDGVIYNLFDWRGWSYHLGPGAIGGNETQSKLSIGIELTNYGFLIKKGEVLYTYLDEIYCTLADTELYKKVPMYRGYEYFATYAAPQYLALNSLLQYLNKESGIPLQLMSENKRLAYTDSVLKHNGIVSHVNYRRSGKWDVSPAFDFDTIKQSG
jgi:N-acetylmuramoyl-L-alanine amidase